MYPKDRIKKDGTAAKKPGPRHIPEKFRRPFRGRAKVEDIEELGGAKAVYRLVSDWVESEAEKSRNRRPKR